MLGRLRYGVEGKNVTAVVSSASVVRDSIVAAVLVRMSAAADIAPYLRGPALAVVVRLTREVVSRCVDALDPGADLSGGADALHPVPGEPAAVRAVLARVLGTFAWERLAEVIGPHDTPPHAVCRAVESLFDSLVELGRSH